MAGRFVTLYILYKHLRNTLTGSYLYIINQKCVSLCTFLIGSSTTAEECNAT